MIEGRVQGVGFRISMVHEAEQLGVVGWVRNCPNGAVEAVVQGPIDRVEAIIRWAKSGPGRVARVMVEDSEGEFDNFAIVR